MVLLELQKDIECKNPKDSRSKKGGIILLSKCPVCYKKFLKFIKEQGDSGLLSNLGINTPFSMKQVKTGDKINEIVCKLLLSADIYMPKIH